MSLDSAAVAVKRTYTFNVNPVTTACSCAAIVWVVPTSATPTATVTVGTTATYSEAAGLALRYSGIDSSTVGNAAVNAAVRKCYT